MCCPIEYNAKAMPSVLIVCADHGDKQWLFRALKTGGWPCRAAETAGGASDALGRVGPVFLVICEQNLPDGDWKDVLACKEGTTREPLLIVTSLHADDRLWSEVLNLGGYDLLMKPFDRNEFSRVVEMAWHHWNSYAISPAARAGFCEPA